MLLSLVQQQNDTVASESMGWINNAAPPCADCANVKQPRDPQKGRYNVAARRALSRVILRLHLHRECSRERVGGRRLRAPAHSTCATRGGVRKKKTCSSFSSSRRSCLLLVCKVLCCFSFETQVATSVIRCLLIIDGPATWQRLPPLLPSPLPHAQTSMTVRCLR